jgi:hypothetical protein
MTLKASIHAGFRGLSGTPNWDLTPFMLGSDPVYVGI